MKLISASSLVLVSCSFVTAKAADFDLTGYWEGDQGGSYYVRQIGDRVYWAANGCPKAINVFCGTMAGPLLTGEWVDLPGGDSSGRGTLGFQVDSNDRIVKLEQSSPYPISILRRVDGAGRGCGGGDPLTGARGGGESQREGGGETTGGGGETGGGEETTAGGGVIAGFLCPDFGRMTTVTRIGNDWSSLYTRRGAGNIFDVKSRTAAASSTGVSRIRLEGNKLFFEGLSEKGEVTSRGEGTVDEDGVTLEGTWYNVANPSQIYNWSGTIDCAGVPTYPGNIGKPGSTSPAERGQGKAGRGGEITDSPCDDPSVLETMDVWLMLAVPPQKKEESLRYEKWGRLVGRSLTANLTVPGPPTTPLTRCEYLWKRTDQLTSTNFGTLKEFVEANR